MNRRRFLKYSGATAALVGASALGIEYFARSPWILNPSQTIMSSQLMTSSASLSTSTQLASLEGRLFFDYNGNGKQDGEEPAVAGALVQLKDYVYGKVVAETLTDSSGDYRFEDIKVRYSGMDYVYLHLSVGNSRLRYMCRSPGEFRAVTDDYGVPLQENVRMDIGLMEGFLTLPMSGKSRCEIDRFYDRNPDPDKYLWWNGRSGYDRGLKRGWSPNHRGIDYYIEEGEPLLAQAPG